MMGGVTGRLASTSWYYVFMVYLEGKVVVSSNTLSLPLPASLLWLVFLGLGLGFLGL